MMPAFHFLYSRCHGQLSIHGKRIDHHRHSEPALVLDMPDSISASCVDNTVIAVDIISGAGDYTYEWTVGGVPYGGERPPDHGSEFVTTPIRSKCWMVAEEQTKPHRCWSSRRAHDLDVSPDTVICRGRALSLSAVATGGEGGFVYSWSSIPAFGETQYVAPSNSYSYPVEVTDICGETLTETIEVEVQYIYSDFYTSYLSDTRLSSSLRLSLLVPTVTFDWNFGDGASRKR